MGTTFRDAAGHEVTIEGEIAEQLAHTLMTFFFALATSTAMLKAMVDRHVQDAHGGDWNADCGILQQLAMNDKLIGMGVAAQHAVMPESATCH